MYINNLNKFLIFFFLYCLIVNIGCNKDEFGDTPEVEAHDMNQETTNIQLEVSGLNNTNGQLAIAIFDNADSFEDENNTYKDSTVIITDNAMIVLIENVNPGTYAISIFHDENENEELDVNWLGMPIEGFGFSNNPSIGFSAPQYEDCNFTIEENQTLGVPIELIYF
ncbi:MAG: hypothetical protein CMD23_04070 [Flavobacteriales bacterium]|nr:hypothetical protein [Flavobacteriales bacterium]|tara:strand:+ start:251 stop:751 length:501 start_codon:yes stop_codon:yes gene_type:complete